MPHSTATKLRKAADRATAAVAARDALIVTRRAEGASLRTIGDEAGLPHTVVERILRDACTS